MKSVGLLFEPQRVLLVCLKKGVKGVTLHNYRIISLKEVKQEERENLIREGIEAFMKETRAPRKNLYLGIPRDQAIFKFIDLPLVVEENLANVLQYELDRYTPFTPEDIYLDYSIVSRDQKAETLRILLVAIKKSLLDRYLMLLERLNIRPRGAEITSTAIANIHILQEMKKKATLRKISLPDFKGWLQKLKSKEEGKSEKDKGGFRKKLFSLFARRKQKVVSSSHVIKILSYLSDHYLELNVLQNEMLAYSRAVPLSSQKGVDRVQFLVNCINRELDLISLSLQGFQEEVNLLLSGTELDSGLPEKLKRSCGLDPIMINAGILGIKGDKGREVLPLLTPVIGLAVKGLKEVPLDINLIPVALRPREIKYLKEIMAGILLLSASIAGGNYYYNLFKEKEAYLNKLTQDVNQLRVEVIAEEEMQREVEEIKKRITILEGIKKKDVSKITILKELTTIIPLDVWLTDFSYRAKESKIEISGFAFSASNLISMLEESPLFEKVQFTSPIVKGSSVKENFRMEATITQGEVK